jgi:hypothetical protein
MAAPAIARSRLAASTIFPPFKTSEVVPDKPFASFCAPIVICFVPSSACEATSTTLPDISVVVFCAFEGSEFAASVTVVVGM